MGLHIQFSSSYIIWGAQFVFVANIVLGYFAVAHGYDIELQLYPYVESNGKAVAAMSLAIAVFWVFVTKGKLLDEAQARVRIFLWLLLWAFLISVLGTLPLYWVPPGDHCLTVLRHLKSVPLFYSIFLLGSALIVFLYELEYKRTLIDQLSQRTFGEDAEGSEDTEAR